MQPPEELGRGEWWWHKNRAGFAFACSKILRQELAKIYYRTCHIFSLTCENASEILFLLVRKGSWWHSYQIRQLSWPETFFAQFSVVRAQSAHSDRAVHTCALIDIPCKPARCCGLGLAFFCSFVSNLCGCHAKTYTHKNSLWSD